MKDDNLSESQETGKKAIADNAAVLTDDEYILAAALIGAGQGHLFENWPAPGIHDEDKRRMMRQLAILDAGYDGGLKQYCLRAKELLLKSGHGMSSTGDLSCPEAPPCYDLDPSSQTILSYEKDGYKVMNTCAFVLVAGGLGERLGYSFIKLALPAEITTGKCFLQHYIENILALQNASDMAPDQRLPLIIMTSDDTHQHTLDLLHRNSFYGADPSQVSLIKQEQVAALADVDGRLALKEDDPYELIVKPHGHGDIHALMFRHGIAQRLVESGYRWIYIFQDTNALAFKPLPACLGVSAREALDVNTMAVPRTPGDACGALLRLRRPDGTHLVNNIEYNEGSLTGDDAWQVEALLAAAGVPDLDPSTGRSPFPGNTNQLLLRLEPYAACLAATRGAVPEFVNPKYAPPPTAGGSDGGGGGSSSSGGGGSGGGGGGGGGGVGRRRVLAAPTRLECMLQDLPRLLPAGPPPARVSATRMERWIGYSPVKCSLAQAAGLAARGLPPMSASTGESDLYHANSCNRWRRGRELLRIAGMAVTEAPPATFNGVPIVPGPRVVFAPSFAVGVGDVLHKVKGGSITARSTLIVAGAGVRIHDLVLDGTLIVRAVPGASVLIKGLSVTNRGWALEPLKQGGARAPEELRVRGYQLVKYEQRVLEFNEPGDFECRA